MACVCVRVCMEGWHIEEGAVRKAWTQARGSDQKIPVITHDYLATIGNADGRQAVSHCDLSTDNMYFGNCHPSWFQPFLIFTWPAELFFIQSQLGQNVKFSPLNIRYAFSLQSHFTTTSRLWTAIEVCTRLWNQTFSDYILITEFILFPSSSSPLLVTCHGVFRALCFLCYSA